MSSTLVLAPCKDLLIDEHGRHPRTGCISEEASPQGEGTRMQRCRERRQPRKQQRLARTIGGTSRYVRPLVA